MEIIAVISQKGGVGKTTSTANIGSGLSILGKKVLLVDLDPQAHLGQAMGIANGGFEYTIYNVLRGDVDLADVFVQKELGARIARVDNDSGNGGGGAEEESRLHVTMVPSSVDLSAVDMEFGGREGKEYLLRNALEKVADRFDFALIDCPPSLGLLTLNALSAASSVHIPVQTEFLALDSLDKLLDTIDRVKQNWNPGLAVGGIIATRFDGRKVLNRDVVSKLKERFGPLLFDRIIRENIALAEAPGYGVDIFTYRPRSYGAEDYLRLSEEILERSGRYGH
jgi:chromosome partitioning protein